MKRVLPALALGALMMFSGCGSNGGSDTSNQVTVERGPILGAVVIDADGQQAQELANGSYEFAETPTYPITAYGGYIDVDRDGNVSANDVENTIILKAESGEVLTVLTSLLSADDENITTVLLDDLGLNEALLPGEDLSVAALSDVIYAYLINNNIADPSDLNMTEFNQTVAEITVKIEEYEQLDIDASGHELDLVLELDIKKLDDAEAEEANEKIKGQQNAIEVIMNLPNMSDEQKEHVIAMISKHGKKEVSDDAEADDDAEEAIEDAKKEKKEKKEKPENPGKSGDSDDDAEESEDEESEEPEDEEEVETEEEPEETEV